MSAPVVPAPLTSVETVGQGATVAAPPASWKKEICLSELDQWERSVPPRRREKVLASGGGDEPLESAVVVVAA